MWLDDYDRSKYARVNDMKENHHPASWAVVPPVMYYMYSNERCGLFTRLFFTYLSAVVMLPP